MDILGIKFAPLIIPLHRRLETLSTCVVCLLIVAMPFISIGVSIYLCFTKYWWFIALYVTWIILDKKTPQEGGRAIEWIRSLGIFRYARDYFPIKARTVPDFSIDPKLNYLCGWFPHGFLPLGVPAGLTSGFGDEFSNHTIQTLTVNCNFYVPFFRDFLLSLGMCKASPESINYLLNYPKGGKLLLLPVGGSHEALYFKSGEYRITLKNRKGFIKLALKNGSPVIPIFSFGENEVWKQVIFDDDSLIRRFQLWARKKINVAFVLLLGRGIFQYTFGLLPFRKAINVVVGKPLHFGKIENPTQDDIDAAHKTFVEALVSIFETYKYHYEANPEKCQLIIE